ncbi:MAG: hypothetical protein KJ592_00030 [Nanoarchaeota archaeon]|nr:hypothetical protein [Nanoarchaeota archaeon]
MDPIKEAFFKIKQEISSLKSEITELTLKIKNFELQTIQQTNPTHNPFKNTQQTDQQSIQQTNPTHNKAVETLYANNNNSSIGNDGVPTNRPTDQQTNRPTLNIEITQPTNQNYPNINSDFKEVNKILSSLDSIKKEIRLKFKRLTPQEMLVFSTLYALEEQNIEKITYRILATEIKLSESSIRDYINKLTNKGVPIEKIRQNNKTIILKISKDLKNIATLATIQNLREL